MELGKNFLICAKCGGRVGHLMKSLVKPWKILCFSYVRPMFYVGVRGVKGAKRKPLDGVSASGGGTSNRNKKLFYDANVVKLLVLTKFLSVFFRLIVKKNMACQNRDETYCQTKLCFHTFCTLRDMSSMRIYLCRCLYVGKDSLAL